MKKNTAAFVLLLSLIAFTPALLADGVAVEEFQEPCAQEMVKAARGLYELNNPKLLGTKMAVEEYSRVPIKNSTLLIWSFIFNADAKQRYEVKASATEKGCTLL